MRRNTEPAVEMGIFLRNLREETGMSMQQVARNMGVPAATVSQIEKGQRALKEPRIADFSKALGVKEDVVRTMWISLDGVEVGPDPRGRRGIAVTPEDLEARIKTLNAKERSRVQGYLDALLEER